MTQIEKHEKAIKILENIDRLDFRIESNQYQQAKMAYNGFGRIKEHYLNRVFIDTKMREKLINYYNKNFKL